MDKLIKRQDAIVSVALAIWHYPNELYTSLNCFENCQELAERALNHLPSAEPEIAENLYLCKCYITDKDGLQHEVIYTDDIRRMTGWEI